MDTGAAVLEKFAASSSTLVRSIRFFDSMQSFWGDGVVVVVKTTEGFSGAQFRGVEVWRYAVGPGTWRYRCIGD